MIPIGMRWKQITQNSLFGWHDNAVYDSRNKAVIVFGTDANANDIVVYRPAKAEHVKMPTPGKRPPKDQHNPMCFDPEAGLTAVLVDRVPEDKTVKPSAETWLYDLATDSWLQLQTATLPFTLGMNYCMEYDPCHKICILAAMAPDEKGSALSVFALKIDATQIK